MEITQIETEYTYGGVPVTGWWGVVGALATYAIDGKRKAVGHRLAGVFYRTVIELLEQGRPKPDEGEHSSFHITLGGSPWDGLPFNGIAVDSLDSDRDLFEVHVYAPGQVDETLALARFLQAERVLNGVGLNLYTKPLAGERFEIDFEDLARAIGKFVSVSGSHGHRLAEEFASQTTRRPWCSVHNSPMAISIWAEDIAYKGMEVEGAKVTGQFLNLIDPADPKTVSIRLQSPDNNVRATQMAMQLAMQLGPRIPRTRKSN